MTRLSTVKDQVAQADGLPAVLDTEQAWCLTLVTNAVVAWTTDYYGPAVDAMRKVGRQVPDDVLAHISPAHSDNVNYFGAPSPSTSTTNSPSSTEPATGPCVASARADLA